ncbi:trypsin-like serine protease [Nocardia sp. NRRL S-836]|uniref:S1 family peptidase n=1 Tax=Nocardia sp. NRRL S-836 TaxID=1519492 RepID=UPI0006AE0D15|nr:trypsin-like serine protease [Nocardia sp. NRRL S-836]KOV84681.1 hypothetical protein ADL03_15500 [Nocardia sp. NRRL S-836]
MTSLVVAIGLLLALATSASGQIAHTASSAEFGAQVLGGQPASQVVWSDPSGEIGSQIVGGRPASQYYDGLSALEYDSVTPPRDDHMTCTAVLLDDPAIPGRVEWGLTAAHCVAELPAMLARSGPSVYRDGVFGTPLWVPVKERAFQLRAGNLDRTLVAPLPIKQVVIAPEWEWIPGGPDPVDRKPAADLAMVRLSAPAAVRGATVADAEPLPGVRVRLVGWGRTSNQSAATPTIANELRTRIVQPQACAGGDISVHDLCTDNPAGAGACNADSGAPAYQQAGGRWQVTGLVSRGATETCGGSPDVITGLAYYTGWIEAVMQDRLPYLPVTAAQGGDPGHPTIRFSTTAPLRWQSQFALAG